MTAIVNERGNIRHETWPHAVDPFAGGRRADVNNESSFLDAQNLLEDQVLCDQVLVSGERASRHTGTADW